MNSLTPLLFDQAFRATVLLMAVYRASICDAPRVRFGAPSAVDGRSRVFARDAGAVDVCCRDRRSQRVRDPARLRRADHCPAQSLPCRPDALAGPANTLDSNRSGQRAH